MNPFRAKKIAHQFNDIGTFTVSNKLHGVVVGFHGNLAYFEDESTLWPFLFHIAHAEHHESLVAEAEARLIA